MSEENVEVARRWLDGLARGELSLEMCDPELLVENIAEFPITGPYHGHEGLQRWWEDVAEAFDEIRSGSRTARSPAPSATRRGAGH